MLTGGQVAESGVQRGDLLAGMNDLLISDAQEIRHELSRLRGGSEAEASLLFCPGDAPDCVATACPGFGHRLSLEEIVARAAELAAEDVEVEDGADSELGAVAEAKIGADEEMEENEENRAEEKEKQELAAAEEDAAEAAASKAGNNDVLAEVIKSKDAEAAEAASNPWSGVFNVKWVHAIGAKSAPPRTAELAAAEGVEAPAAAVENAPPAKPSKSTWAGWLTGAPPPIPNEEAVIEEAPSNEGLDEDGSSSSSPEDEPLTQEEHEEEKEEEASETPSTAMGEAQETAEVTQESDEGEALDEEAAAAEVEAAAAEEEVDTGGAVVPPRTGEENDANVEELSNAGEEAAEAGADEASNTVEVAGADVEGATMVEDAAVDTEETEAQVAASLDAMAEEAERTEEAVTEEMPAASSVEVEEVEDSPAADPENTPAFPEQPEPESLPEMDESAAAAAVVGDEVAVAPQVEEEALPPKASTSSWGWGWFSTTPTEKPAAAPEAIAEETAPEKGETVVDSVAEENSGEELATVDKETSVEEEEAPVEEETSVDTEAVVEETPVDNSSVDATVAEFVVTAADEVPIEGSSAEDVTVEETAAQEASLVDFADEAKEAAAAAIRTALEAEGFDANEIEAIVEQHLAETAAEDEATMAAEQAAAAAAAEELAWKTAATAEPDAASIVARLQAMSALEEQAKEEAAKVAAAAAAQAAEAAAFVPAEPSRHAVAIEEFEAAAPGVSPTTVLVNPSIAEVANAAAASAAASAMEGAKEDQAATGASAESKSWWGWMTTAPTPLASDTKGAPNTKNEAVDSTTASDGQNNAEMTVAMGEGEPSVVAPLVLDEPTVEVEAVVEEAAETVEAKEIITEESGEVETEEVQAAEKEETAGESPNDQAGDEGQREGGFSEMAETAQSPASDDSAGVSVNQDLPTIHDDSSTDTQLEEVVPAAEDASSQETSVKDDAVTEAITSPEVPAVETPAAVVAPGSWWSSYFPSLTGGATTKEAQSVQIPIAPQEEEDMPTRDSKEAEKEETSDEVNAATVDFESPAEGDEASAGAAETGAPSEEVETVAAEVAEAPPHEEEAVTTEAEDSADEVAKALQGEDVAESGTAEEAILAEQEMLATADLVVGEEETSIDQVAAEDEASKLAEVDDNANGTSEAQNSVEDPAIEATESDASATVATTAVDSEVALAPQVEEEEALSPKAAASSWGWGWFSTTPTEKPAAAPETIAEKTAQEEGETANEEESAGAAVATDDSAALLTATDAQPDAQEGEPGEIVATAELEMEVLSAEAGPVLVVGDDPGSAAPSEHGEVRLEEDEIAASVDVVESAPPHEADVSENMPDLSTDVPVLEEGVPDDETASMTEDVAAESNEGEDAAAPAGTDTMAAEIESDETMAPTEELSPLPETAPAPDEPLEESKPAEKSSSLWGWFSSSSSSSSSTVPKPDDAGADVDSANVLQDDTSLPAAESKEEDEAPVAEAAPEEKHEDEGAAPQPLEIASGDAEEEEEDLADTVAEVKQEPSTEAESVEEKEEEATDIIKESVDAPIDDEAEESGIAQDTVISANATETVQAVVAAGQEALATSSALNSSSSSGSLVVDVAVVDSSWSEENAATVVTMPGFGESDGRFEAIVEEAFVEVDRYITEVALAQLYPQPLPPGPLDPALCGDGDLPCAISASEIGADVLASFRPHARLHSALASRSQLRQTLAAHRAAALRASLEWGAGSLLVVALAIGLWIFKGRPNFIGERAQEGSESTDEVHGASSVQEPPLTVPVKLTMKPQVHFQEERQQQEGASKSSVVRTLDKEGFRHAAASSSPSSSSPKGGPLSPVVLSSIEERGKWQSMREASMAYANAPTSASSSSEGSPSIMPTMHQSSSHASLSSPSAATATTAAGATGAGAASVTPSAATGGAGNSDDDASSAFDLRALRDQLADTPDRYAALERAHAALRANPDALSAFADLASSPTGGDEDDEEEADVGVANAVQNEAESAAETTLAETKARAVTPSRSSASALESSAPLFMLEYCDPVRKVQDAILSVYQISVRGGK